MVGFMLALLRTSMRYFYAWVVLDTLLSSSKMRTWRVLASKLGYLSAKGQGGAKRVGDESLLTICTT